MDKIGPIGQIRLIRPIFINMKDGLKKINSQIQYALSYIVRERYPDYIVSLTDVLTTKDLEYCDILVSVLNDDNNVVDKLNHDAGKLRHQLAESVDLRRTPELRFYLDNSDSNYDKIDKLIRS